MTARVADPNASLTSPSALVALPGTGSDADYARRAFGPAADALGVELIAVDPDDEGIEGAYRRALDSAAAHHDHLLVAGVSIGACVAVDWAVDSARCVGVFAALPPWIECADDAPAAHSARATVDLIDRFGIDGAIEMMVTSSPKWLGNELSRSWSAIGSPLRAHLIEAARMTLPSRARIAALRVPLVITAARDDPIHPAHIADAWAQQCRRAVLRFVTLDQWGSDPAVLGRECLHGWRDVCGRPARDVGQRP